VIAILTHLLSFPQNCGFELKIQTKKKCKNQNQMSMIHVLFLVSPGPVPIIRVNVPPPLLEALVQSVDKSLRFVMAQLVRHLATSLLKSCNDKSMSGWYVSYIEAT
jgi:hypothetical protein